MPIRSESKKTKSLKEAVENHPVVFFLTFVIAAFGTGFVAAEKLHSASGSQTTAAGTLPTSQIRATSSPSPDLSFDKILEDRYPRMFSGSKNGNYYVARLLPDRASMQLDTDMRSDLDLTKTSFDMYANNAGFVLRSYNKNIEELIKRNVSVRFLLSDWSYSNKNLDAQSIAVKEVPSSVRTEILKSKAILDEMTERYSRDRGVYRGKLEVRYSKALLLYTSWIRDRNYAHIEIQLHGGKDKWPSVRFGPDSGLVERMANEFENLWADARPMSYNASE